MRPDTSEPLRITTADQGIIGWFHNIEYTAPYSILVFQLPRPTEYLSEVYIKGAKTVIDDLVPSGRSYIFVGSDVNIYELAGEDAVFLKLQGKI